MKRYMFQVIVDEGCDEFWESLKGKSGCDEVTEMLCGALEANGFDLSAYGDCSVTLLSFSNINKEPIKCPE